MPPWLQRPWIDVHPAIAALLVVGSFAPYAWASAKARSRNVAPRRAIVVATALAHATVVLAVSGRPLLAVAVALCSATFQPWPSLFARFGFDMAFALPVIVVGSSALALASGIDAMLLAALPVIAANTMGTVMVLRGQLDMLKRRPRRWPIEVGDVVPDLVVPAHDGHPELRLTSLRGQPIILLFIRGNWCPICQILIRSLQKQADLLAKRGVRLVLVTPTGGPDAIDFVRSFGVRYDVVSDPDCVLPRAFGVMHEKGWEGADIPFPSAFVVNARGLLLGQVGPEASQKLLDGSAFGTVLDQLD